MLSISLWLADDLFSHNYTFSGVYIYPSHISQTIHLMLAERYSNGSVLGILSQPVNRSSLYYLKVNEDDVHPLPAQAVGASIATVESLIAASHLFLPAHYVGNNYHKNTGVIIPNKLSLHWGELKGFKLLGRTSSAMEDIWIDAGFGFPEAQVWLAHMYSFGKDGFALNETLARLLYEEAAAAGNTEALYTMGVYYATGTGGVAQNASIAYRYFLRAANDPYSPHATSLHALGNHFAGMHNNPQDVNFTESLNYYRKAAASNSSAGHYSYAAMLMRHEVHGNGDAGVVSKIIYHFGRAMELGSINAMIMLALGLFDSDSWVGEYYRESIWHNQSFHATTQKFTDKKYSIRYSSNGSMWFRIYDSDDYIKFEYPYPPNHRDGLKIMKYMSEMLHRVRQLKTLGIDAYFYSDYSSALEYLEEAADLGSTSAQMNTLYVLEKLRKSSTCSDGDHFMGVGDCARYMELRILRRLLQLSNSGERYAKRNLADILMRGSEFVRQNTSLACRLYTEAAEAGDALSVVSLGWISFNGADVISKNNTLAKLLFMDAFYRELFDARGNMYSTYGVAPLLSYCYVSISELMSMLLFNLESVSLKAEICAVVLLVLMGGLIVYMLLCLKWRKLKLD